ncbi:hypothetical protein D4764_05G0014410 [Takifugu flavidus]|uniref:Uncharacterized protein n=1 Tax=Takifugu flavidus TaxID=433684 RepID=A0A5C6N4W8_9TELE|nr:hypothetical protein D4764_05G0014410 [Takifugu flavidus]
MRLNISSLARLGRGPENAPESHIVFASLHTDSNSRKFASMSPAPAPGMLLTMVAGVGFTLRKTVANYQGRFLNGCVAKHVFYTWSELSFFLGVSKWEKLKRDCMRKPKERGKAVPDLHLFLGGRFTAIHMGIVTAPSKNPKTAAMAHF